MSTQCSVCVITKHIGVFFFFFLDQAQKNKTKKLSKKKTYLCESGNVVIVFARKMCNIRFSDGSRFQRRTPMFKFCTVFLFSSQFLRSLNAFWSWGWPGNLRTYTNAPEIQKTTGFYFSLVSLSLFFTPPPFLLFFCDSFLRLCFFFIFRLTQALIQVSFSLPHFVLLLFIAHVMNWFPLPHLIQGVLGLEWGWNFLHTKTTEAFVKS